VGFQIISAQSAWKWQNPLPQGNTLNSISFIDSQYGWAVAESGHPGRREDCINMKIKGRSNT
jgi:hypothetical protein